MKKPMQFILLLITCFRLTAQMAVTMPGDFEKSEGLILNWNNQEEINLATVQIITLVQQQAVPIWILYQRDPVPMDTTEISLFLISHGATMENIHFLPAHYQGSWIRNFGPMMGYGVFDQNLERFIYDAGYAYNYPPEDDSIPAQLAHYWHWPLAEIPLELDGGNLLNDGLKRGFSTKRVLEMNPLLSEIDVKNILKEKYNLNDWVFLETLEHSGGGDGNRLDGFMLVLDFETILVSEYPNTLPDYEVIESNILTLQSLTNAFGRPYTIFRVPAPPMADGTFTTTQQGEMRTYTNALILNNQVMVPSYGLPWYDSVARAVFKEAMPGYQISMVDASALTPQHGAIRSLSEVIPQSHYLRIEHKKITGYQPYQPDVQVTCISKADELVEDMWLYYRINSDTNYTKTPIFLVCPEHFGVIEGLAEDDTVHYYLEANSTSATTTYPLSAPDGNFTFWFDVVSEIDLTEKFNTSFVFPNPGNGMIRFQLSDKMNLAEMRLYTLNGQLLFETSVANNQPVNIKRFVSPGLYLVRLNTKDEEEVIKLIIY